MSLYENIRLNMNDSLVALRYENKEITYKKLVSNINKLITYFKESGLKKGDVVTIVLPNIPSSVYVFYALNAIGVIQNIIHPLTSFDKIIETSKETDSKGIVLLSTLYQDNIELINRLNFKFFFANPMYDNSLLLRNLFYIKYKKPSKSNNIYLLDDFYHKKECLEVETKDDKETSIYLHSGGTTGTPKVIELSDFAINNLVSKIDKIVDMEIKGKSMLAVLPMFHGFGLGMGIHAPLSNKATVSLMMRFNVKKVIKWINQNKVNMIIGVPLLYQKLLREKDFLDSKLTNLDYCFIGGDNVPQSLISNYNDLMKNNNSTCLMLEGYGLTETVTVCNVNTRKDFKIGSVGKPLIGVNIKILNEDFLELEPYEIGEVFISGDTLMNAYKDDLETTNKTMVDINGKVYIRSGDLGYLDSDGFLFLKGRKKRMFKISGMNVYPSEIEHIATDNNDVIDASLEFFNEPKPHLVLYLIKNKYSLKDEKKIIEELSGILESKVLKYALPSKFIFMESFPKTNVGKIDHSKFKE